MTSYYVELTFEMGRPLDKSAEAHFDEVAEAFADLTDVDGDVGVNLEGRVDLCMTLSADDRAEAWNKAVTAARTAIHAAGGRTAGWEGMLSKLLDDDEYLLRSAPSAWSSRIDCLT